MDTGLSDCGTMAERGLSSPQPSAQVRGNGESTNHPEIAADCDVRAPAAQPTRISERGRWLTVVVFAAAMAWVESAVVFYLRTMIDRIEPYQPEPLPLIGSLGPVELAREAATLIMLFTVGLLAGRNWRSRLGYAALAFGVWDIFYYVFLKVMCGWPHSIWDWDILFLLPLPWWGPVLAPVLIACLMIAWGTLVSQFDARHTHSTFVWPAWTLNFIGIALALYVFMADALRVAHGGRDALRQMLPAQFNWPLFCIALLFMAAPVLQLWRQVAASGGFSGWRASSRPPVNPEAQIS